MCIDPGTLASLSMGMQIAGTAAGVIGSYQQAKAQKQAYEYEAAVARNNQQIAKWQADDALRRGQLAEEDHRRKVAQLKGTQRASMAARGLDLGEGTALNILTDTDFMGERDALLIRENADREAWAYRNQASNYGAEAGFKSSAAGGISPGFSAATTLLTGAGQVADKWYRTKQSGVWG